jgi:hypothetical protein
MASGVIVHGEQLRQDEMTNHHPCDGMTAAETRAFEDIATGRPPRCSQKTLLRLIEAGLVIKYIRRVLTSEGLPLINIWDYEIPLSAHCEFCEWSSQTRGNRPNSPLATRAKGRDKRARNSIAPQNLSLFPETD